MAKNKKSSAKRQEARKASWARREVRTKRRVAEQESAHRANESRGTTAWAEAKAKRTARRAAAAA